MTRTPAGWDAAGAGAADCAGLLTGPPGPEAARPARNSGTFARTADRNGKNGGPAFTGGGAGAGPTRLDAARPRGGSGCRVRHGDAACRKTGPCEGLRAGAPAPDVARPARACQGDGAYRTGAGLGRKTGPGAWFRAG